MNKATNTQRIVTAVALFCLLAGGLFLNGCNTWEGAGKDVQRAGEKMQGNP